MELAFKENKSFGNNKPYFEIDRNFRDKVDSAMASFRLVFYAKSSDQEFAVNTFGIDRKSECAGPDLDGRKEVRKNVYDFNTYNNYGNYDNYGNYGNYSNYNNYGNYDNYGNYNNMALLRKTEFWSMQELRLKSTKISDIIKVRNDGFILNLINGNIFYADEQARIALDLVKEKRLLDLPPEHAKTLLKELLLM